MRRRRRHCRSGAEAWRSRRDRWRQFHGCGSDAAIFVIWKTIDLRRTGFTGALGD
jgi:hypothetical protein